MANSKPQYDPGDIKHFVETERSRQWHTDLRMRMDEEFTEMYCLEQTPVSKKEGEYDYVIDNAPRVFADKLIEELSSGKLVFTIPIYKEQKAEKTHVSMTEQAVYGLLNMADDALTAVPYGCPAQAQMAWYTTTTGFIIERFWMYEDNDHGEKIVVPDLALWHFANTFWSTGRKGINRICHVRYASASELNDQYGLDLTDRSDKGVEVYDHWDDNWEQVIINGEEVHKVNHKRGYVPARIITAGAMPVINIPDTVNTSSSTPMKYIAPSCWAKGRDIWLARSEVLTYYKTLVGKQVNRPKKLTFDSTKGGKPVQLKADPDQKGAYQPVDIGMGQDVLEMYVPELTKDAMQLNAMLKQMGDMASAPEIMYGVLNQDVTAQGTAMLLHAAMASMKQGKRAIEQAMGWFANEVIRQYKAGKWKDIQVQGMDGKETQFATAIKRDDLVTDRRVEAKLNIDSPQDEMENVGKAVELKKMELADDEYIWDKMMKVADPEAMAKRLAQQRVRRLAGIDIREAQAGFIQDKDEFAAAVLQQLFLQVQAKYMQVLGLVNPESQSSGSAGGMPGATIPGAMPGQQMAGATPSENMRRTMKTGMRPPGGG